MEITLNSLQCSKKHLTMQEALIAIAASMGPLNPIITNMKNRGILTSNLELQSPWYGTILKLIGDQSEEERLLNLAIKVQECFPIQKLKYNDGRTSPFYFRCNKTEIKDKLKKFFALYGDVPDEDVIDATKRYVASYASKDYIGMRLAKYFILKDARKLTADEEVHVEQLSDLATFLENKPTEEDDIVNGDDWLVNSRN